MQDWFKVELQFVCPSCDKVSTETMLTRAENKRDPDAVAIAIKEREPVVCRLCKAIRPYGVPTRTLMMDLTPEELANLRVDSGLSSKRLM
jgi:hypothetical protein